MQHHIGHQRQQQDHARGVDIALVLGVDLFAYPYILRDPINIIFLFFDAKYYPDIYLFSAILKFGFAAACMSYYLKNSGYTNMIMHAANAATIKKFVLTARITAADIAITRYLPTTGISAIHIAAISMRL